MTMTLAPEQTLQETMSKLEGALLAPVISGELLNWLKNVRLAAVTFGTDWARYLHSVLHESYEEIGREDPDLAPCIDKMTAAEAHLLEEFAKFQEEVHELVQRAKRVAKHESKLAEHRQRVEDMGLALLTHIKKQKAAADTWLSESLYRDRGVGD